MWKCAKTFIYSYNEICKQQVFHHMTLQNKLLYALIDCKTQANLMMTRLFQVALKFNCDEIK
jgi:hypothetical protein